MNRISASPLRPSLTRPLTNGGRRSVGGAFTLIELLVVIGIIGVLLAILFPVLGKARESAQGITCRANQKKMMSGWLLLMGETDEVIPYTRRDHGDGLGWWYDELKKIYDQAPNIRDESDADYDEFGLLINACPTLHKNYSNVRYTTRFWGYAVNSAWGRGDDDNGGERWGDINKPSTFPWFADPDIDERITVNDATPRVPRPQGVNKWLYWGVGGHHLGGTAANISYADYSVRPILLTRILRVNDQDTDLAWFENR